MCIYARDTNSKGIWSIPSIPSCTHMPERGGNLLLVQDNEVIVGILLWYHRSGLSFPEPCVALFSWLANQLTQGAGASFFATQAFSGAASPLFGIPMKKLSTPIPASNWLAVARGAIGGLGLKFRLSRSISRLPETLQGHGRTNNPTYIFIICIYIYICIDT